MRTFYYSLCPIPAICLLITFSCFYLITPGSPGWISQQHLADLLVLFVISTPILTLIGLISTVIVKEGKLGLLVATVISCTPAILATAILSYMYWHPHEVDHGVPLSGSEEQIRASILEITPLGTPIKAVKASIHTRLHPDTFCNYKDITLPGSSTGPGSTMVWAQWPLGGEHHGKMIVCEIGRTGPFESVSVGAYWAFDNENRLADVFVGKNNEGP
jgi:hypothetical protein